MKIDPSKFKADEERQRIEALKALVSGEPKTGRPCPGCAFACPRCGSQSCRCLCSADCEYCAGQLSSEPDRYPIEEGILPLVYELTASGVVQTCWSCEGHAPAAGRSAKPPCVWFYSPTVTYPLLMLDALSRLKLARRTCHTWQIRLIHWGSDLTPTYSLEPQLEPGQPIHLGQLRQDVLSLAATLEDTLINIARDYLAA